jgi:hypothetical protein
MNRLASTALLAAVVLTVTAAPSSAGYLDFFIGTAPAGSVVISPGSPITGSNISVTDILGEGTNANDGVGLSVADGKLSFTTGAFLGADSHGNQTFDNGGSVVITGTVDGFTGTLFNGKFDGPEPIQLLNLGHNKFRLVGGEVIGTVAPALAKYYDFLATSTGGFSLLVGGTGVTPTVNSGNIALETDGHFPTPNAVPEPASLCLVGLGLAVATGVARRRRAA